MPEAPVYGDLKVATRALDAPQINPGVASADAFGVGEKLSRIAIAQGAKDLGMGVIEGNRIRQAAAEKAQQERNDFEVLDASNQTIDAVNDIKAKAFQVQGSNAIGLNDRTRQEFQKIVDERTKNLKTPESKAMFAQRAAHIWNGLDASIGDHAESQIQNYNEQTLQGSIDREGMDAIDSMNPARIADAEKKIFVARQALSTMKGVSLDGQHAKDASDLYATATDRYLSAKDWKGAADFYADNKEKILPHVRDKLQGAIKEGSVQGLAELETARITMPSDGVTPTRTQAMAEANKVKDPEVKARTITSVRALYVEKEQAHESDQQDSYNALNKVLRENAGDLNSLPPAQVSNLDAKWWKTLQADAREFVGEVTPTKKTYANLEATDTLRKVIDQGFIAGKDGAKIPVSDSAVRQLAINNGLTAEQTHSVTEYHKQGGNKGSLTITQVEKAYEYVSGGRKYDDDRKKYPTLYDQIRERIPAGQEITADILNKAMAPLLVEGEIVAGGWYDPNTTYGAAVAKGSGDKWLPTVDGDEEKRISKGLHDVGVINVTPEVVRKWKKYAPVNEGGLGMPTPLRDGRPMSHQEAVLAGSLQGNIKDLPPALRKPTNIPALMEQMAPQTRGYLSPEIPYKGND